MAYISTTAQPASFAGGWAGRRQPRFQRFSNVTVRAQYYPALRYMLQIKNFIM